MKTVENFKKSAVGILFLLAIYGPLTLAAQPIGFVDQLYVSGWNQVVGFTWDGNGRMYAWEKNGKVWIVENGSRLATPLLDISDEVGGWRDFGLVGFTLDPDFLSNGYFYLLYVVDREHLMNFGPPAYDPLDNDYYEATIGRVTRYQADASTNFNTVVSNSRQVLIGESTATGMPILHESHGVGQLVFGSDNTLLVSMGDGASYSSTDQGSAGETYWQQALNDGIITAAENIGAYRSQLLDSYNGKFLRIDPQTGDGLPSNPFYDAGAPRSARSRVWARGARNPYRFCKIPNTGSFLPSDGNPGVFIFGDVGWGAREEFSFITGPGQNFGWPKYEGMTNQPGYNNSLYAPATHERPRVDWRNSAPRVLVNGTVQTVGSGFPGPTFQGNASTGGFWYTGTDFPSIYQNTYFQADYGGQWIMNFAFDGNYNPTEIRSFMTNRGPVVFLAAPPVGDGFYYVKYPGEIRQVTYVGAANQPPVAIASADLTEGPSPLVVTFTGSSSYDPEFFPLTYLWDFGDGTTSTLANPSHTFTSANGGPDFVVTLTVTDDGALTDQTTINISLDNSSPVIQSTSIDNVHTYPLNQPTTLNLSAVVYDAESSNQALTYSWQVFLFHNGHNHPEAPDNNPVASVVLSPVGCDGDTYWYRVILRVTDPGGLSATFQRDIFPDCPGQAQTISFAPLPNREATDGPFSIGATASSGLPVDLYITGGPATLSGNTVTLLGVPGPVSVAAVQSGNASYAPATPVFQSFQVTVPNASNCNAQGTISREVWTVVSGVTVAEIPVSTPPNTEDELAVFEIPVNVLDNYGTRLRGFICPPVTGAYTFWIASDDNGELWLSTDDNPANKVRIAYVPGWSSSRQWNKFPQQQSAPITLQAGQSYYIEALMKEQGGGDNLAVRWQLPGGTIEEPIPGSRLSPNVLLLNQTISFTPVGTKFISSPAFSLSPGSTSGLPVTAEVIAGPASVSGNTVTLDGSPGTVIIKYSQAGDGTYKPAVEVFDNSVVLGNPPWVSIDFPSTGSTVYGNDVEVQYSMGGDLVNGHADHLHLMLDGPPHITIHNLTGTYVLPSVSPGAHTLMAQLVSNDHQPLTNPEAMAMVTFTKGENYVLLPAKVFLQGPFQNGLMDDQLRANGSLPLTDPYAPPNFIHVGTGGESVAPTVFAVTGTEAIVDWVFLELRDKSDNTTVVAARSALVQRDGDIVDVDGVSPVLFTNIVPGDYFVVVRHRNHLAIMTGGTVQLDQNGGN